MNDREHRLRERIDQLTDERDRARARAALIPSLRNEIYRLKKTAALWRMRARQERAKH